MPCYINNNEALAVVLLSLKKKKRKHSLLHLTTFYKSSILFWREDRFGARNLWQSGLNRFSSLQVLKECVQNERGYEEPVLFDGVPINLKSSCNKI